MLEYTIKTICVYLFVHLYLKYNWIITNLFTNKLHTFEINGFNKLNINI